MLPTTSVLSRHCLFLLTLLMPAVCHAQWDPTTSTTTITMSAIGPGVIGSTTGDIPFRPGFRALGPISGAGANSGYLAVTQWYTPTGDFKIYGPPPSIAIFTNQASQDADATTAGELTIEATFTATYTIGAGGTIAQLIPLNYSFGGLIGPAGGLARFDTTITYTHSILGLIDTLSIAYTTSTPGPISFGDGDVAILPALPAGVLTVSGNIRLRVDDNPGDHVVTELGAFAVAIPEPATWLMIGSGASIGFYGWWRMRRSRAKKLDALLLPDQEDF